VPIGVFRGCPAGVEAMAMLAKGQVHAVLGSDSLAQRTFVHRIFSQGLIGIGRSRAWLLSANAAEAYKAKLVA
jgi:hypothetical protein